MGILIRGIQGNLTQGRFSRPNTKESRSNFRLDCNNCLDIYEYRRNNRV